MTTSEVIYKVNLDTVMATLTVIFNLTPKTEGGSDK